MHFNILTRIVLLLLLFSCSAHEKKKAISLLNADVEDTILDTVRFVTSGLEFVYLCERLYPSIELKDLSLSSDLVAVESTGDTLMAFLMSDRLNDFGNTHLPYATDSMLNHFYPNHFDVELDDDLPYFAYLRSEKDYFQFMRDKNGEFAIVEGLIKDTVVNVFGQVKIGMSISEVFEEVGMPQSLSDRENCMLILCNADLPKRMWYQNDARFREFENGGAVQVLLVFKESKLVLSAINPWIGYGWHGNRELKSILRKDGYL